MKKVLENNENETQSRIQAGTHRSKWIVLGKTNSSTTVSEKVQRERKEEEEERDATRS